MSWPVPPRWHCFPLRPSRRTGTTPIKLKRLTRPLRLATSPQRPRRMEGLRIGPKWTTQTWTWAA